MASIDSAESAVTDNVTISRLLEFERVLALAGDRGFCFESGDLKVNMFPASKASSPPGDNGSWRQPVAAAAATKSPKKHRAAKRKLSAQVRPAPEPRPQAPVGASGRSLRSSTSLVPHASVVRRVARL